MQAAVMLSKFVMNSASSLATIILWERRPYTDRSTNTDKMNESSFFITAINNLLKLARIVEASFGCCDGITVELDEAKLGSCSCGWIRGAFDYETCFFFFLRSIYSWLLITRIKDCGYATNDPTICPTKYISSLIGIGSQVFGINTFSVCIQKLYLSIGIPWIFVLSEIYLIATWCCVISRRVHVATYNSIRYISTKSS